MLDDCQMGGDGYGRGDFSRLPPPLLKNPDALPLGTFETKKGARTG